MRGVLQLAWVIGFGVGLSGCASSQRSAEGRQIHEATEGRLLPLAFTKTYATHRRALGVHSGYHVALRPPGSLPLGESAPAFAEYLVQIHKRVHPLFAHQFLTWADHRPPGDPIQNPELSTTVDLVIDGKRGRLLRQDIVRSSYLTLFDTGVVSSIQRASPFGPPPSDIVSADGNVHVQWELHRDPMACSAVGMHPFLLGATAP